MALLVSITALFLQFYSLPAPASFKVYLSHETALESVFVAENFGEVSANIKEINVFFSKPVEITRVYLEKDMWGNTVGKREESFLVSHVNVSGHPPRGIPYPDNHGTLSVSGGGGIFNNFSPLSNDCNEYSGDLPCLVAPGSQITLRIAKKQEPKDFSSLNSTMTQFDLNDSFDHSGLVKICLTYSNVEEVCLPHSLQL
ncbi:hypothetical protein [Thalassospira lucentensis]|uniref:hypothetical protein n=1 Tax=Thalassospira lucentensis TaxID=168935 RepID=UPI003AA8D854